MSDDALIAELERQREFARQYFAYLDALGRGVVPGGRRPNFSEVTRPLTDILARHPVFGRGGEIFFALKPLYLHPWYVPRVLLPVMLGSDAPSAVAWLHRLFSIDSADLRMVTAVHGLEVEERLNLANRVRLVPLTAAPDSPNLRSLAGGYQAIPVSVIDIGLAMPPTIAVFGMGTVAGSTDFEAGKSVYDNAFNAILQAARAFTLTDGGAPVVGKSWTDFVDPELTAAEFGQVWTVAHFEGSPSPGPLKVDGEAFAWAERYLRMDSQLRPSVDVVLDRLNLARRRRSPGDKAIDGGICLEALLGDDSPQELTYRLQSACGPPARYDTSRASRNTEGRPRPLSPPQQGGTRSCASVRGQCARCTMRFSWS